MIKPLRCRIFAKHIAHHQSKVEAGALPGNPAYFVPKYFMSEVLLVFTGGNRNRGDRVHVVDMPEGDQSMQGCVYRAGRWV